MKYECVCHLALNYPYSCNVLIDIGLIEVTPETNNSTNIAGNGHQDVASPNFAPSQDLMRLI